MYSAWIPKGERNVRKFMLQNRMAPFEALDEHARSKWMAEAAKGTTYFRPTGAAARLIAERQREVLSQVCNNPLRGTDQQRRFEIDQLGNQRAWVEDGAKKVSGPYLASYEGTWCPRTSEQSDPFPKPLMKAPPKPKGSGLPETRKKTNYDPMAGADGGASSSLPKSDWADATTALREKSKKRGGEMSMQAMLDLEAKAGKEMADAKEQGKQFKRDTSEAGIRHYLQNIRGTLSPMEQRIEDGRYGLLSSDWRLKPLPTTKPYKSYGGGDPAFSPVEIQNVPGPASLTQQTPSAPPPPPPQPTTSPVDISAAPATADAAASPPPTSDVAGSGKPKKRSRSKGGMSREERGAKIRKIMAEQHLKLPAASKWLKEHPS